MSPKKRTFLENSIFPISETPNLVLYQNSLSKYYLLVNGDPNPKNLGLYQLKAEKIPGREISRELKISEFSVRNIAKTWETEGNFTRKKAQIGLDSFKNVMRGEFAGRQHHILYKESEQSLHSMV